MKSRVYFFLFLFCSAFLISYIHRAHAEEPYPTLWTEQMGTSTTDYAHSVAVDNAGNAYVTGFTYGGLDGNTNAGDRDIFLVKYDANGNKLWTEQIGSLNYDVPLSVAVDGAGNAYVAGYTWGGLDGNTNAGAEDIFLVKYDASGNKLWTRQMGTISTDHAHSVAVDGAGNTFVVGGTLVSCQP